MTAKDASNAPASKTKSTRETRTTEEEVSAIEPVAAMPLGGEGLYPQYNEDGTVKEPKPEQHEDDKG